MIAHSHRVHNNVWSFDRKTYTWSSPKSSRSWNPADFTMKSDVSAKTLLILQGLGWISPEIRRISRNLLDFMKSARFHTDFMWNRKTFARNCNSMFILLHNSNKSMFNIQHFKAKQYKIVKLVLNVQIAQKTVLKQLGQLCCNWLWNYRKGELLCNIWNAVIY